MLNQAEKLYILLLYIVCFDKLNLTHCLMMLFMLCFLYFRKTIHKNFVLILFVFGFQAVGRMSNLMTILSGVVYSDNVSRILIILGIDVALDPTVMIYKLQIDWELIFLYFCSYTMYRITQHLNIREEAPKRNTNNSDFVKFFSKMADYLSKTLLWVIYFVLLVLFANMQPTIILIGYELLLLILISIHIFADLNGTEYTGYLKTKPWWLLLRGYNVFLLCITYAFSFTLHTIGIDFSLSESLNGFFTFIGLDTSEPVGGQLQKNFLPQFIVLYCGFLAKLHINSRMKEERKSSKIEYSHFIWYNNNAKI